MAGCIIPRTPLAVDFWKRRDLGQARLFFLSHMHSDHTESLSSSWNQKIYCSEITKSLAVEKFDINPSLLIVLPVGEASILPLDEEGIEKLTVTPIDANHCPGAVMFLFEGYFGRILYTGDFRYFHGLLDNPLLNNDIVISRLYLDNTYCDPKCEFPTKAEATLMVMNILLQHPTHDIVFALDTLGKEELLYKVAVVLGVSIVVDNFRLKTTKLMGIDSVFTMDPNASHVRVLPKRNVNTYTVNLWNKSRPTVAIIPTCLYLSLDFPNPFQNSDNIFVVPYSDHSSFSELQTFVAGIKPQEIVPIVKKARRDRYNEDDPRTNMSVFANKKSESGLNLFDIPKSVLSYMSRQVINDVPASKKRRKGSYFGNKAKKACGIVFSSPNKKTNSEELNDSASSVLSDTHKMTIQPGKDGREPRGTEEEYGTKNVTGNVLENSLSKKCVNQKEPGERITNGDKTPTEDPMENYLKEVCNKGTETEELAYTKRVQTNTNELESVERFENSNSEIKESNIITKEKEIYLNEVSKNPIQVKDFNNVYMNEFDHKEMGKIKNVERKEVFLRELDKSSFHFEELVFTASTPKGSYDKEIKKDKKNQTMWLNTKKINKLSAKEKKNELVKSEAKEGICHILEGVQVENGTDEINPKSKKSVVGSETKKVENSMDVITNKNVIFEEENGKNALKEGRNEDRGRIRKQASCNITSQFQGNSSRLDRVKDFATEQDIGNPGKNKMKSDAKAGKVNRKKVKKKQADKEKEEILNGNSESGSSGKERESDDINQSGMVTKIQGNKQKQVKLDEIFKKLIPGKETSSITRINIESAANESNDTLNKPRSKSDTNHDKDNFSEVEKRENLKKEAKHLSLEDNFQLVQVNTSSSQSKISKDNTHATKKCAEDREKLSEQQNITIFDETPIQRSVSHRQILKRVQEVERKVPKHTKQINLCADSLDYNEHSRYCISCIERREAASTVENSKEIEFAWQVLRRLEAKNKLQNIQKK